MFAPRWLRERSGAAESGRTERGRAPGPQSPLRCAEQQVGLEGTAERRAVQELRAH